MIGFLAVRHVERRSYDFSKECPTYKQITKAANAARKLRIPFPVQVSFSSCFSPFNKSLRSSLSISQKKVTFNYEWLARAVLFGDTLEFQNAFRAAIGHLVGHKVAMCPLNNIILPQCRKFVRWMNEYYADYYAMTMALGGSRERMASALDYMRPKDSIDVDTNYSPSWSHRKEAILRSNFDPSFVFAVAQEAGCTNFAVIQRVCNFFFRNNQAGTGTA